MIVLFCILSCWTNENRYTYTNGQSLFNLISTLSYLRTIWIPQWNLQIGWWLHWDFEKDARVWGSDLLHLYHIQCSWPSLWSSNGKPPLKLSFYIEVFNRLPQKYYPPALPQQMFSMIVFLPHPYLSRNLLCKLLLSCPFIMCGMPACPPIINFSYVGWGLSLACSWQSFFLRQVADSQVRLPVIHP